MATAVGSTIGALRVVIGADTTGLQRGLRDAGNRTADFKKQALVAAASIAAIGTAAAAAGAKLVGLAREQMGVIDSQVKLTRAIGGTVNGLRAFKLVAEDMGIDGVEASLNRFNRRMGAAEFGAGAAAVSVKMLGLDLKALANMDVHERMAYVADAIKASGMSAQQAARHLQNMGFEQQGVAELFMQGGDAIRASTDALEKYGLAISQVDAEMVERANGAFDTLRRTFEGIKTQLAVALAPALERVGVLMESFAGVISTATPYVGALIDALATAAEVFAVAGAAAAAFFGPAMLSSIASFTTAVGVGAVGAVKALTAAMLANPIGAIAAALVAAGYAAYKFRDQINEAIGIDVIKIAKTAANTVMNSFVAAYEDIKFVWSNFGDMMGGAVVGGINVAIRAINALITGALSGINSLVDAVNKIPGVDIGKIGDSAKIELLDNEYSKRLVDAVKERNAKIAEIMSTDRFASAPDGMVLTSDPEKPTTSNFSFSPFGEDGASAGSSEKQSQAELQALREQLEARLQMLREFTATEQELEIFRHNQRLEDLREIWEAGVIPTEAEMMELREALEQKHQDRLTEISEKAEQERARNIERWAQFEMQQRAAVVNAAVGLLDQFAGESKAAALASIALSKGLAIAQIVQNTAAAQMRAMAELGPLAGPPMAAKIGAMGAVQAGIVAATGLAQAASVSSRGTGGLQGGASGSVGGRSSAPSSGGYGGNGGGSSGPRVNINLIEDRSRAGQVDVNRSDDEEVDADVFVADIRGGGPRAQALQETFNLRRVGS